ncbi:MAG: methyltransferase [Pseudomonadota bacterium]
MRGKSKYKDRVSEEIQRYREVEDIHDLPSIHHYWSGKYLSPLIRTFGFDTINDVHMHYMRKVCRADPGNKMRFISIGSGNCETEVFLAASLVRHNVTNFSFECLDLNQSMLDRGAERARENAVENYMVFSCVDLNSWDPGHKYDVVLALQCLHHFVELESIFHKIHTSLSNDGFFVTHDMIGRNGHMRWPETRTLVDELWSDLPDRYKYNQQLKRMEKRFLDWDCSQEGFEGIRAQDIMPLLTSTFHFELLIHWGGVIDVFTDRMFGHNFSSDDESDRNFIDKVEFINREKTLSGQIKPTQMIAAMGKSEFERKLFLYGMTPEFCTRNPTL